MARGRAAGTWVKLLTAWREQTRRHAGREPTPSAACLASPSVNTTERGGAERGDEGGQQVKGRQRQLVVDTLDVGVALWSTGAGWDDGGAAPTLLQQRDPNDVPRRDTIVADHQSHNHGLQAWMAAPRPVWRIAVKTPPEGAQGFTPLEKRWVVEGTNAWPGRSRRHSQDDERPPESRAAMIALRHLQLRRRSLTAPRRPAFQDRNLATEPLK